MLETPRAGEPSRRLALDARRARLRSGPLCLSCRGLDGAPPCDAHLARGVGEPQQEIAVACLRCTKAHEIASAQFVERTQQIVLVRQPSLILGDDGCAIAVAADPERIAPFAAAPDIDGDR